MKPISIHVGSKVAQASPSVVGASWSFLYNILCNCGYYQSDEESGWYPNSEGELRDLVSPHIEALISQVTPLYRSAYGGEGKEDEEGKGTGTVELSLEEAKALLEVLVWITSRPQGWPHDLLDSPEDEELGELWIMRTTLALLTP